MAVGDAYVFPGFLTPVLTQLSFQSHQLLFSHASAEVRGENMPERKFATTEDRTHNHHVMSLTRSPLSHRANKNKDFMQYSSEKTGIFTAYKPLLLSQKFILKKEVIQYRKQVWRYY